MIVRQKLTLGGPSILERLSSREQTIKMSSLTLHGRI